MQANEMPMKARIKKTMARPDMGVVWIVIILFALFSVFGGTFMSAFNLFNLFRTAALFVYIALAQSMVSVTGGTSLAIGSIGGFVGIFYGEMLQNYGIPILPASILAVSMGFIIGYIHGVIITKLNLNTFITTLATQFIFKGIVLGITKGYPYTNLPKDITTLGRAKIFGTFPVLGLVAIGTLLIIGYFFTYTVTGRRILSTGGNKEAARLSGINVDRMVIYCNCLSGIFAALAAVLYTTRLGSIQANLGDDWVMMSFAITTLAANTDGRFSALGVGMGAIMMVMIDNGMTIMKVDIYFEEAFIGGLILLAIALDSMRNKSSQRAMLKQAMEADKRE